MDYLTLTEDELRFVNSIVQRMDKGDLRGLRKRVAC